MLLYNPLMGALLLLPHGCSVKSWHAGAASQESLLRLCALSDCMTAYYVLVMRLSAFYVMLSLFPLVREVVTDNDGLGRNVVVRLISISNEPAIVLVTPKAVPITTACINNCLKTSPKPFHLRRKIKSSHHACSSYHHI